MDLRTRLQVGPWNVGAVETATPRDADRAFWPAKIWPSSKVTGCVSWPHLNAVDSLSALGTDAQGNIYIADSMSSRHFPVKNAVQPNIASSGLYLFSSAARTAFGLSSCCAVALDPQDPSTIFAMSEGALVKSLNSGLTFAPTTLPSSHALSIVIQLCTGFGTSAPTVVERKYSAKRTDPSERFPRNGSSKLSRPK